MKIYLVQHGDALSKEIDPDRALSPTGHEDLKRIAAFLKRKVELQKVWHSGKTRARQSAEILAATLAPGLEPEAIGGINPNDPVESMVNQVNQSEQDLLIVGHLPYMAKLVAALTTGHEKAITAFQPGSIVCLASDEGNNWQIEWMLRPNLL